MEKGLVLEHTRNLIRGAGDILSTDDINATHAIIKKGIDSGHFHRDKYGINPTIRHLRTACMLIENIAPDRSMIIATMLYELCKNDFIPLDDISARFGDDIAKLVRGLLKVSELYRKQAAVENDNFHKLLLTFAEDIRVIIIMIVDRLNLMREINHHPDEKLVHDISNESRYLYAPLAHRLGLYVIKSELEDLSLKYLNRNMYTQIAHKLNETKKTRDEYIENFIRPIKKALTESGLNFTIKGRTKSINSIWNKMRKQDVDINGMYDLFAIRIIIDTPKEKEKKECWIAYSIVTDIYTANISRLKDWITIPKSNGYESLHITVNGPNDHWVEVQIRTKRMDEIAERGLAAHWKYKGIKSEGDLDEWMNNVRDVLEAGQKGPMELIKNMQMNIYDKEVFVFTPKGDLYKLPLGATVLDFAFHIHSKIGCQCVGGKIDGKNQKLNYKLKSGDTVEVITSSTQTPRLDWLNFVVTSKARNKIKQSVNEMRAKEADIAKELLQRRFKNRKIEPDEAKLMKVIKKLGFKQATDFFVEIANDRLDVNYVLETYLSLDKRENEELVHESAEKFVLQQPAANKDVDDDDVLIIGDNVKGINYKLAKCCNPIMGDKIKGFVASDGAIKIHRIDCKNLSHLLSRYPYREIKTQWTGKIGSQFAASLRIIGLDELGIVTNITSVINKEKDVSLRSISIDSHDGLFQGFLVIGVGSTEVLNELTTKIKNLKGVKDVKREM
ncbi:MAG: RelA/SpoT family protein [Muribaculaceae bacterium]